MVPPKEDGSKAPVGRWKPFQKESPTDKQMHLWYRNRKRQGVGIVTGAVSNHLEMFEFEGRAAKDGVVNDFEELMDAHGHKGLWERIEGGYKEKTPSGGYHFLYYAPQVGGSTPLARDAEGQVLIETRGEGGYTIIAPSHGSVHPTGEPWVLMAGGLDQIATITTEERDIIFAVARMLDRYSDKTAIEVEPTPTYDGQLRPGDLYNAQPDILRIQENLLVNNGFTLVLTTADGTKHLTRPGKDPREGISVTLGSPKTGGKFYVFSTSIPDFEAEKAYDPFSVYAILEHGGDWSAAARQLRKEGFHEDKGSATEGPVTDGASNDPPIETYNAADLMRREFPPIRWAVQDLIPEGLSLLAGGPKIGKSWMALDIGLAIASGADALDRFQTGTGSKVLVIAFEDSEKRLQDRLRLLGVESHAQSAQRNLLYRTDFPTLPNGGIQALDRWLTANPDCRLVVLDTWQRFRVRGSDRNAYAEETADATELHDIALKHRIAILVLHHTRKAEADDFLEKVSGTNGLAGSCDTIMVLERARQQYAGTLHVTGRDFGESEYAVEFSDGHWKVMGPAAQYRTTAERERIVRVLVDADEPMKLSEIAEAVNKTTPNVSNMLRGMLSDGLVVRTSHGKYAPGVQGNSEDREDDKPILTNFTESPFNGL